MIASVASPVDPPVRRRLSVVVTCRNDDHGGGPLRRMQLFVDGLLDQAARHHIDGELIVVEWNPPPEKRRLADALRWWPRSPRFPIRLIEVAAAVHSRHRHADRLPLFQMVAKNVGIRRAEGEFILATNIDVLLSEAAATRLARGGLHPRRMYRMDRTDVGEDVPVDLSPLRRLDWCANNILRVNAADGTHATGRTADRASDAGSGSVGRLRRGWRTLREMLRARFALKEPPLHTNACGDFTMLHRDAWRRVRGYAEFEMYSWKIDGLLCYAAHADGARQVVWDAPCAVYHIEHAAGSGWQPGRGAELLNRRLADAGVPQLDRDRYHRWVNGMRLSGRPVLFNRDRNWGLADVEMRETRIA